jgi:hypothetical protein
VFDKTDVSVLGARLVQTFGTHSGAAQGAFGLIDG